MKKIKEKITGYYFSFYLIKEQQQNFILLLMIGAKQKKQCEKSCLDFHNKIFLRVKVSKDKIMFNLYKL